MDPATDPAPLDYSRLPPRRPRPFNTRPVVLPFAAGLFLGVNAVAIWTTSTANAALPETVYRAVAAAWGLAAMLLVGLRVWAKVVLRGGQSDLVARPWWALVAAGMADFWLFVAALGRGTGGTYALALARNRPMTLAVLAVAVGVHVGWATVLTRRVPPGGGGG